VESTDFTEVHSQTATWAGDVDGPLLATQKIPTDVEDDDDDYE
jgi:hypothetical protein